jgi:hypothetical protein
MPSHTLQILRHLALAISFSATVCVSGGCDFPQSVNPFYRSQDVVFDSNLLGEWQSADPSDKGGLLIKASAADSYTIDYYDEDLEGETTWTFEARKFAYQQDSYLGFFPTAFRVSGKRRIFRRKQTECCFWSLCIP